MSSKYYAVSKGRSPGIYNDWETTKQQVNGYPGAKYKSFTNKENALSYIKENNETNLSKETTIGSVPLLHNNASITKECDNDASKVIKEIKNKHQSIIYTDGSCIDKIGGYGIIFLFHDKEEEYYGKVPYNPCTNNIAELYAIKKALKIYNSKYSPNNEIILRTDSKYSINCVTEWINKWTMNNWMTSSNKPVENKELILSIDNWVRKYTYLNFEHVYGHKGEKYNELVDKLADLGRTSK